MFRRIRFAISCIISKISYPELPMVIIKDVLKKEFDREELKKDKNTLIILEKRN